MFPTLLVIDNQKAIDDPKWGRIAPNNIDEKIAILLTMWRENNAPIIHIRHDSLDPDSPYAKGKESHKFKVSTAPIDGEILIGKTTNNGFVGTELEKILEDLDTKKIIVSGVLVQHSIDTTARMAASLGYDVTIARDACAASDMIDLNDRYWTAEKVSALTYATFRSDYGKIESTTEIIQYYQ
jgi:nicotinamidase-related amidase